MTIDAPLVSDLAVPPGDYLTEVIAELDMSQAELARRMGRPHNAVNEIIQGRKSITAETALQLENVTGVPAHIWTGLEEEYRLVIAKNDELQRLSKESELVDSTVYHKMAQLGWVKATRNRINRTIEFSRFLGVDSLHNVSNSKHMGFAFRLADRDKASSLALAAWLRKAELEAREQATDTYDRQLVRASMGKLKGLSVKEPAQWYPAVQELLAAAGVALVLVPHLPKTFVNGATFWLSTSKAVVALSLRGAWADIFWFTLFHELGHVLLHGKRDTHISIEKSSDVQEIEANEFASDSLIPRVAFQDFKLAGNFSQSAVEEFAAAIGVSPGIVVGRLQHESLVPFSQLNNLRERYKFSTAG